MTQGAGGDGHVCAGASAEASGQVPSIAPAPGAPPPVHRHAGPGSIALRSRRDIIQGLSEPNRAQIGADPFHRPST